MTHLVIDQRVFGLRTLGPWRGRGGWLEGPDALKPWREPWPDDTDIGRLDAEMVERADRVPWTYSRSPAGASQRRVWWLQRQRDLR